MRTKKPGPPRLLLLAVVLLAAFLLLFDRQWRPLLLSNAMSQAKILVTDAVTPILRDTLADFEARGEPLLTMTSDQTGQVRSLSLNALAVDRLKSDFLLAYQKNATYILTFRTTLGTLSGLDYLNALGPYLTFSAEMSQCPDVEVVSTFEEAGINQTLHRVVIRVCVDVCYLFPGGNHAERITTEYLAGETVLLGDVPSTYAYGCYSPLNVVQ